MSIKLSYILPCYNVERYIADCLDSIYAQDMPEEEYEVICVNDCSTDGTRDVVVKYASKHANLILIDHAENLTVGVARNTGIKAARGEYVWFVDPDDMIKSGSAKTLYGSVKDKNLDALLFNFEIVDENVSFLKVVNTFVDSKISNGQNYVVTYFPDHFSELCIVWRCVFRRSFLVKNQLSFPKMRKAEDVSFLWKVMLVAERVASISGYYYTYRNNPYSIAHKTHKANVVFSERILFANEIGLLLEQKDYLIQESIRQDMLKTIFWCANSNLELLQKMTYEQRSCYYDEMVCNKESVERVMPYMNRKQKMLFSVVSGKHLWLLKIKMIDVWEKFRKKKH